MSNVLLIIGLCVSVLVVLVLVVLVILLILRIYKKTKECEEWKKEAFEYRNENKRVAEIDKLNSCDLNSEDVNSYLLNYISERIDNSVYYAEHEQMYTSSFLAIHSMRVLADMNKKMQEKAQKNRERKNTNK